MGIMRTLFDYAMTGDWEKTQRIQLYKKLGKSKLIEELKDEQTKNIND